MKRKSTNELIYEENFDTDEIRENRKKHPHLSSRYYSLDHQFMVSKWGERKGISNGLMRLPWKQFDVKDLHIGLNYLLLSCESYGIGSNRTLIGNLLMHQFQVRNFEMEMEVNVFIPKVKKQIEVSNNTQITDSFIIKTNSDGFLNFFVRSVNKFGIQKQSINMRQPAIWCTGFSWEVERLLWIGKMKNNEECPIAKLPREIIRHVINMAIETEAYNATHH
jgi:hypothetical protein